MAWIIKYKARTAQEKKDYWKEPDEVFFTSHWDTEEEAIARAEQLSHMKEVEVIEWAPIIGVRRDPETGEPLIDPETGQEIPLPEYPWS